MIPRQWQPPFRNRSTLEKICEGFRAGYCAGYPFPLAMDVIAEKEVHLDIIPIKGIRRARVSAFLKSDFTGIVVDLDEYLEERYQARLRFSIAHELGHLVMHQDLYHQVQMESIEDYIAFIRCIEEGVYRAIEFQANFFAAVLLVPRHALVGELSRALKEARHMIPADFQSDPDASLRWIAPAAARRFGVSEEVIERRIEEEGLSAADIQ